MADAPVRTRKRPPAQKAFTLTEKMIGLIGDIGRANLTKNKHTQAEGKAKKALSIEIAQAADGNQVPVFEQTFEHEGETKVAEVSYLGGEKQVVDMDELRKRVSPEDLLAILLKSPASQAAVKDVAGQNILDLVLKTTSVPPSLSVKVKK